MPSEKSPHRAAPARNNPYRTAAAMFLQRLKWDLHPESWRSRKNLKQLKASQKGKKGLILCNGPSLNQVDFDLLHRNREEVFAIGLNKINLLFERTKFRPAIIVAVNELVIEQNLPYFRESPIPLFLNSNAAGKLPGRKSVTYLHLTGIPKFARDVTAGVQSGFTVTFVAMQLAFHLGIRDLAVVGCDHNFATRGPANKTVASGSRDESHFDPRYFAGGVKWQLPDLSGSEYYYSLAGEVFDAFGGRIFNCTDGGKLELYPRLSLEAWINGDFSESAKSGA